MLKAFRAAKAATAALTLAILTPAAATAAELGERFELRGFGTAAVTHVDSDRIEFRRHVGQGNAVGDGDFSFDAPTPDATIHQEANR